MHCPFPLISIIWVHCFFIWTWFIKINTTNVQGIVDHIGIPESVRWFDHSLLHINAAFLVSWIATLIWVLIVQPFRTKIPLYDNSLMNTMNPFVTFIEPFSTFTEQPSLSNTTIEIKFIFISTTCPAWTEDQNLCIFGLSRGRQGVQSMELWRSKEHHQQRYYFWWRDHVRRSHQAMRLNESCKFRSFRETSVWVGAWKRNWKWKRNKARNWRRKRRKRS